MSVLDTIIQLLAPHICLGCGAEGAVLCSRCVQTLPSAPSVCYRCGHETLDFRTCTACCSSSPLMQVWAATPYEALARAAVHRFKYERAQAAAGCLAAAMMQLPLPESWLVVPVPTTPARIRQRGYDQALLLARSIARQLNSPAAEALVRQNTVRQVGQSGEMRRRQMKEAFKAAPRVVVENKNVLLIDDVVTTGATLEAAAQAMHAAGARLIAAAVFARA